MKSSAKILASPVAEWPQMLNSTKGSLQDLESELSALTQRAALLHAYLSHRYNTGCGDQGHAASVKVANKQLVRIRKAMGFSYPDRAPLSMQ